MADDLHEAVEGAAAVGDAADLGIFTYEYAAFGVLGGVAAVDADALVVGHADEQRGPALEPWAHRHYYRVAAFGYGGLALGLAPTVMEINPMRLKGVAEIGERGECPALTAADAEAANGIGRTLRDAFQMEFYHSFFSFSSDTYKCDGATLRHCDGCAFVFFYFLLFSPFCLGTGTAHPASCHRQ